MHKDFVCHVATEVQPTKHQQPLPQPHTCTMTPSAQPYKASDWSNKWIHITNHGVQRQHKDFDAALQTLSLEALCEAVVSDATATTTSTTTASVDAAARAESLRAAVQHNVALVFQTFKVVLHCDTPHFQARTS